MYSFKEELQQDDPEYKNVIKRTECFGGFVWV